ncbi:Cthe_2314 family HEPN domain-containing protein [Winogradskyella forsetii]|uniref:Cthe_2314 family HEPN domain-containing protein n=1 Tax=Winogradskyella forsetii TaxID=2686077 RepID=UPI0015C05465|nr:Cthe_2314 family HEPN domain-containing protein [Winogradskyella forsetii]
MALIDDIQNKIVSIYNSEGINMLRGIDDSYELKNGKQILVWNTNIISEIHKYERKMDINLNPFDFYFMKNLDNILFTSDELAYYTANAFLYKDKINNPIKDSSSIYDKKRGKWLTYYPNFQNLASKRYSMFIAGAFEKLYNLWDRLGDLLWASYFQDSLKERAVDFSRVIDLIDNTEYNEIDSFKWLLNFKNSDYKELNDIRKNIVHYSSIDIEHKYKHMDSFENNEGKMQNILSDKNEVEKLMNERFGYYDFLKTQIEVSIEGFIKVHELIEEITNIKLANVA